MHPTCECPSTSERAPEQGGLARIVRAGQAGGELDLARSGGARGEEADEELGLGVAGRRQREPLGLGRRVVRPVDELPRLELGDAGQKPTVRSPGIDVPASMFDSAVREMASRSASSVCVHPSSARSLAIRRPSGSPGGRFGSREDGTPPSFAPTQLADPGPTRRSD